MCPLQQWIAGSSECSNTHTKNSKNAEKELKDFFFYYDIFWCLEKPRDFRNALLKVTVYFNNVAGFKVNVKNLIFLLYIKQYSPR